MEETVSLADFEHKEITDLLRNLSRLHKGRKQSSIRNVVWASVQDRVHDWNVINKYFSQACQACV